MPTLSCKAMSSSIVLLTLGCWMCVGAAMAKGPSFDCGEVETNSIEAIICKDERLATLDRKLAEVYAAASKKAVNEHPPVLKAEQRGWIKGRNDCWKDDDNRRCVQNEYVRRIVELQAKYSLVSASEPVYYACEGDLRNEVIATFFQTEPPTLIAERGDQVSLMYLQPSGSGARYQGRNESLWEHQGEAIITWGYGKPGDEMHEKVSELKRSHGRVCETHMMQVLMLGLIVLSVTAARAEHPQLKAFPAAKEGMERFVIVLPHKERDEAPDELPPGVKNVWLNVLADAKGGLKPAEVFRVLGDPVRANGMLGRGKTEAAMKETYRDFIRLPSANASFRQLFTTLGERGNTPALFHCTTGKDRTGWAAAALLTLLGVPKETVMQDYLRSNDYILPHYQKEMDGFVAKGGEPSIMPALFGVKAEYIEATFDEIQKRYGTMERYLSEGLGIDAAKQKALREIFLEYK